jgi:S1-C subfamily serine protease
VYKPYKPYLLPDKEKLVGTGFIIDSSSGLLVTNSHVIRNASQIYATFPDIDHKIPMRIYSMCIEKDLALIVPTIPDDLNKINKLPSLVLGNHLELTLAEPVMTIGYPAGSDTVKVTTGVVSGFGLDSNLDCEDIKRRDPTYIQITAPINPGNSGGPLINSKGEVVGINAAGYLYYQNIGYAIGSLVLMSVYDDMIKNPPLVNTPTFGICWMKIPNSDGIYIRKVLPDSCFRGILQEGDVVTNIKYRNGDTYDNVVIYSPNDIMLPGVKRRLYLPELVDIIPHNTDLTVTVANRGVFSAQYSPIDIYRLQYVIPSIKPYEYIIFAGMCCQNLNLNLAEEMQCPYKVLKNRYYSPRVIITDIFPESTLGRTEIFKIGDVIATINNIEVKYIDDIHKILRSYNSANSLTIRTKSKRIFTINRKVMDREDAEIYHNYRLYT